MIKLSAMHHQYPIKCTLLYIAHLRLENLVFYTEYRHTVLSMVHINYRLYIYKFIIKRLAFPESSVDFFCSLCENAFRN